MTSGIVFDIMRFSTHDGPGIRTTVFLKGCPLACAWCHNPESQSIQPELMLRPALCIACGACLPVCPQGAIFAEDGHIITDIERCTLCTSCSDACTAEAREIVGREMTTAAVMAEILKDRGVYEESGGGVTFSGGEALMQRAFLADLLVECKHQGLSTALDTSGYAPWAAIESVRGLVDVFLFDLKAVDEHLHRQVTGVSNALILENLRRLCELGHAVILRLPLVPGVNDSPAALRAAAELAAALPNVQRLDVLPYHKIGVEKYRRLQRVYDLSQVQPPDASQIAQAVEILNGSHLKIQVGG